MIHASEARRATADAQQAKQDAVVRERKAQEVRDAATRKWWLSIEVPVILQGINARVIAAAKYGAQKAEYSINSGLPEYAEAQLQAELTALGYTVTMTPHRWEDDDLGASGTATDFVITW